MDRTQRAAAEEVEVADHADFNRTMYHLSIFPNQNLSLSLKKRFAEDVGASLPRGIKQRQCPNPNYNQITELLDQGAIYYEQLNQPQLRFLFVTDETLDPYGLHSSLFDAGVINDRDTFLVWFQKKRSYDVTYPSKDSIITIKGPFAEKYFLSDPAHCFAVHIDRWHKLDRHVTGFAVFRIFAAFAC